MLFKTKYNPFVNFVDYRSYRLRRKQPFPPNKHVELNELKNYLFQEIGTAKSGTHWYATSKNQGDFIDFLGILE